MRDAEVTKSDTQPIVIMRCDLDSDGDMDLYDFAHCQVCFTDSDQGPPAEGCTRAHLDGDNDVDIADYAILHDCLEGPAGPGLVARVRARRDAYERNVVCLDGRASACEGRRIVAYEWRQTGGPTVELSGDDSATPSFVAPDIGDACQTTLQFCLRVFDGYDWSDWSLPEVVTVWMACDANHDGVCNQADAEFISAPGRWGTNCPEESCLCDLEGDLDGNGNVGLADVMRVIAEWERSCSEAPGQSFQPLPNPA